MFIPDYRKVVLCKRVRVDEADDSSKDLEIVEVNYFCARSEKYLQVTSGSPCCSIACCSGRKRQTERTAA